MNGADGGHGPWELTPTAEHRRSHAEAAPVSFWLDSAERPTPSDPLDGGHECELAIVGGGLSGLWAAVLAKRDDPDREVALFDAGELAGAASGRNGGFFNYSLTHGLANGLARYPDEIEALERLGLESFDAAVATIREHSIDCALELSGDLAVAVEPHEVDWLAPEADELRRYGHEPVVLDRDAVRAEIESPLYLGGLWLKRGAAIVDPARLCWGLARVARELGVRIFEQTAIEGLAQSGAGLELRTPAGRVRTARALLATSASPGLVGAIRRRVVPVYDYVLVTEPLDRAQLDSIGWRNRQGVGDCANRFHYYRLTADDRILWGGFDAIYHYASGVGERFDQRAKSFDGLAARFFANFPQLEGIRFSHRWGGAIDTCSRFFAFHGTAVSGRVAYSVGHTGLGVGASRFGARVALDLLAERETEATRLRAMRSKPTPFPPEPLRWAAIELTRNRLAAADRRRGRRGIWLRALDRAGLGFDS